MWKPPRTVVIIFLVCKGWKRHKSSQVFANNLKIFYITPVYTDLLYNFKFLIKKKLSKLRLKSSYCQYGVFESQNRQNDNNCRIWQLCRKGNLLLIHPHSSPPKYKMSELVLHCYSMFCKFSTSISFEILFTLLSLSLFLHTHELLSKPSSKRRRIGNIF